MRLPRSDKSELAMTEIMYEIATFPGVTMTEEDRDGLAITEDV
jgi:hypothetical protein